MNLFLASFGSAGVWETLGAFSGLVTATGVWLRWRSQWHVSDIEEALKNGKISDEAARRRMRFVERRAVGLIFGGLGLLVVATVVLSL